MSLRLWRQLRSFKHPSGNRYKRQQPRVALSMSNKQKRFFRRNKSVYLGEFNRPFNKYVLMQLARPSSNQSINELWEQNPYQCAENLKSATLLNDQNPNLVAFKKANWRFKAQVGTVAQAKVKTAKAPWFFHNPCAVPGVLKMRRLRFLHGSQRSGKKNLSFWCGRIKENLLLYWSSCVFSRKKNSYWALVSALESSWPILLLKRGFNSNVRHGREQIQHDQFLLNGQFIQKVWSNAYPGDFTRCFSSSKWIQHSTAHFNLRWSKITKNISYNCVTRTLV